MITWEHKKLIDTIRRYIIRNNLNILLHNITKLRDGKYLKQFPHYMMMFPTGRIAWLVVKKDKYITVKERKFLQKLINYNQEVYCLIGWSEGISIIHNSPRKCKNLVLRGLKYPELWTGTPK